MNADILESAKAGDAKSQYELGCELLSEGDPAEGSSWVRRAAGQGYGPAQAKLGELYDEGIGVAADPVQGAHWHLAAGEYGDPERQWDAGWLFFNGDGVDQNLPNAARLFLHSVINEDDEAGHRVRWLYLHREGVPGNPEELDWFTKGPSLATDGECLYRAGLLFLRGDGVEQSFEMAQEFLEVASKEHAEAHIALGRMFVDSDPERTARHFEQAAAAKSTEGMILAGTMYSAGIRVPRDAKKAEDLLRRAASAGDPEGCFQLGHELARDQTDPDRLNDAIYWLQHALELNLRSFKGIRCALRLASIYQSTSRRNDAIRVLEEALSYKTDEGGTAIVVDARLRDLVFATLDSLWTEHARVLADPDNPEVDQTAAISYLETKRRLVALPEPQFPDLLLQLGGHYCISEQFIKADSAWSDALKAHIPAQVGTESWHHYKHNLAVAQRLHDENVLRAGGEQFRAEKKTGASTAGSSGCFIATACYGDAAHPSVELLRRFRDQRLSHSSLGRGFIELYYIVSPPLARMIARTPLLAALARRLVLEPLVDWLKRYT